MGIKEIFLEMQQHNGMILTKLVYACPHKNGL
jgi:hypothetical protein